MQAYPLIHVPSSLISPALIEVIPTWYQGSIFAPAPPWDLRVTKGGAFRIFFSANVPASNSKIATVAKRRE
jgi:hypothetical protein